MQKFFILTDLFKFLTRLRPLLHAKFMQIWREILNEFQCNKQKYFSSTFLIYYLLLNNILYYIIISGVQISLAQPVSFG